MLAIPATARLSHLRHFSLLVDDRHEVPLRIAVTCLRRRGTVVALAFDRGLPEGAARLELSVEVAPEHAELLERRIAGLVDVRSVAT
jgi:acetolactate synthase regulatory subunit